MTTLAPYGSWQSPITADLLISQTVRLAEPSIDGDTIYWLESRPQEKGRNVIVQRNSDGEVHDLLPRPLNVRSRAHEYGGGSYCVSDGIIYFVLFDDQRIYRLDTRQVSATTSDKEIVPEAITPEGPYRYADFCIDHRRQQLICVREDHSAKGKEESNEIVAISIRDGEKGAANKGAVKKGAAKILASGNDFYSNPRLSPDGTQLSWLSWDHPNMPWDATECWLANIDADSIVSRPRRVAGGADVVTANGQGESIFQPQWSPAGELFLASDRNNWWNLYRVDTHSPDSELLPVIEMEAEFAMPQWVFGMSTYGFLDAHTLLCTYSQNGEWQLGRISMASAQAELSPLRDKNLDYTDISAICCNPQTHSAVFLGASHTRFEEVCLFRDGDNEALMPLRSSSTASIDSRYIAQARSLSFPTGPDRADRPDKKGQHEQAHGFYYPPTNPGYLNPDNVDPDEQAVENTQPPLLVLCHGGPTGATSSALNFKIQYWSSRGFAVLDVNYRGSTGYGRSYRDRLKSHWGLCDVEDVCAGAQYLVEQGLADPQQLAIKGGSAGGYTVLAALTFSDVFKAGASHYGIGDLETLARDTHKFEARYLDSLVGPYPEAKAIYQQRSPINHTEQLNCPVIFFQGLDDKVVPPNQAEAMVKALKAKGIPTAYVPFEGEGHGFRQGPNIKRALEGELYFYSKVFGFPQESFSVDAQSEPVKIVNL